MPQGHQLQPVSVPVSQVVTSVGDIPVIDGDERRIVFISENEAIYVSSSQAAGHILQ